VQLTPLQRTVNAPRSARRGVGSDDSPMFADRVAPEQHDGEGAGVMGYRYRRCRSCSATALRPWH
jgi:hypothetical protein